MLEVRSDEPARDPARLTILATSPAHKADGIHEYTRRLVASLEARSDVEVSCANPRGTSFDRWCATGEPEDTRRPIVLLQYNPFNFGRWGFAPWLPAKLWLLKRSRRAPRIALMAHEMYYPISDWRSALMGGWQRVQFFAVRALSDVVFTSISAWASEVERHRPRRPVHHLPVASNLTDMGHARAAERERLGIAEDTIVLAAFGTGHSSRMLDYVGQAASAVAATGVRTVVLNLGWNTPEVSAGPSVEILAPGHLEEAELSRYLATVDIYLAPFTDGVSTRRTTFMAAIQHGLPVVGTDGHNTDDVLRNATTAIRLTPVNDRNAFADAVRKLAGSDPGVRAERGARARALYEEAFDWEVMSGRLLAWLLDDEADAHGSRSPASETSELAGSATW